MEDAISEQVAKEIEQYGKFLRAGDMIALGYFKDHKDLAKHRNYKDGIKYLGSTPRYEYMSDDVIEYVADMRRDPYRRERAKRKLLKELRAEYDAKYERICRKEKLRKKVVNISDYVLPELDKYPDLMTTNHIIELGFYASRWSVERAYERGDFNVPKYKAANGRIYFKKKEVQEWIRGRQAGHKNKEW